MGAINPYREFVASISPTEFEELCLEILKGYAEAEHLSDFSIQHNVSIPADDGTYQIDVYARFIAMGVEFKVIAECKRYSSPVSREKVAVLADKVKSLGAHKGIMISTCGFQSGAYEYAKKHGIALLQVINRNVMHIMNAATPETEEQKQKLHLMLDWYNRMPKYYAKEYATMDFPDKTIYPSPKMLEAIRREFVLAHNPLGHFVSSRFGSLILGLMFSISPATINFLRHGIKKTSQQTGQQWETSFLFGILENAPTVSSDSAILKT